MPLRPEHYQSGEMQQLAWLLDYQMRITIAGERMGLWSKMIQEPERIKDFINPEKLPGMNMTESVRSLMQSARNNVQ